MKVVVIGDTHGYHHLLNMPEGDLLVHCGDFTNLGQPKEIFSFNEWLGQQPYKYKVVVPGNHDLSFEEDWSMCRAFLSNATHVLKDDLIEIEGRRIYGSPFVPQYGRWAFMYTFALGKQIWEKIPENLDVLITHGPPEGVKDLTARGVRAGCPWLRDYIVRQKPKYHVFGHIHEETGPITVGDTTHINASMANESHWVGKRDPFVFDI